MSPSSAVVARGRRRQRWSPLAVLLLTLCCFEIIAGLVSTMHALAHSTPVPQVALTQGASVSAAAWWSRPLSLATATTYSTVFTFELAPYSPLMGPPDLNASLESPSTATLDNTWRGLTSYYTVLNDIPYSLLENGIITVALNAVVYSPNVYRAYMNQFLLSPQTLDTVVSDRDGERTVGDDEDRYIAKAAAAQSQDPVQRDLFFLFNQPRLHCFYNTPIIMANKLVSPVSYWDWLRCCAPTMPTPQELVRAVPSVAELVNTDYMAAAAILMVKIFDAKIWRRLNAKSSEGSAPKGGWYNLHRNPAMVCSAPALYTIPINAVDLDSFGGVSAVTKPPVFQYVYSQQPIRVVAVLAQCSHLPVTVDVSVALTNPNGQTGSAEYLLTAVVSFTFMVAFAILFMAFLILMLPCDRAKMKQRKEQRQRKERAAQEKAERKAEREAMRREARNGGGGGGSGSARRRDTDGSFEDEEKPSACAAFFQRAWKAVENLFLRASYAVSEWGADNLLIVMFPPLQWVTFIVIILKVLENVLRAVEFAIKSGWDIVSTSYSLPAATIAIRVVVEVALFVVEMLVGMGWGLAYSRLTVPQYITVSLCSAGAVVMYLLAAAGPDCSDSSGQATVFTSFGEEEAKCSSIKIAQKAFDLFFHLFNMLLLLATTARLASYASAGVTRRSSRRRRSKLLPDPPFLGLKEAIDAAAAPARSGRRRSGGGAASRRRSTDSSSLHSRTSSSSSAADSTRSDDQSSGSGSNSSAGSGAEGGPAGTGQRAEDVAQMMAMELLLRYRGMRIPFFTMAVLSIMFLACAFSFYGVGDYYMEVVFTQLSQCCLLTFIVLYLREESFYT